MARPLRGQRDPSLAPVQGTIPEVQTVGCGRHHGPLGGAFDETARRLSHEEVAVAWQLAAEGHDVRSLAAQRGRGRTADLLVCGAPVEVKSWLSREERGGNAPGARSVVNKLIQAEGQAAVVILNGRGTGLSATQAEAGMRIYSKLPHRANIASVRVFGDTFDLAWARPSSLEAGRRSHNDRERGRRPEAGMSV